MSALIECDSIQGQVIKTRTGFPGAVGASIKRTAERAVELDRIPLDPEPSDQNALTKHVTIGSQSPMIGSNEQPTL
jgi:hypothetical protein